MLQSGIQDYRDNITRFLLIARDPQPLAPPDKTALVFALPNAPGALFKALSVFALRDIDLTKLESRPMRGRPWEYLFYVDLAAGRSDVRCGRAHRAPGGVGAMGQDARLVRALERSGDPGDGNRGPNRRVRRVSAGRQLEEGLEFQAVSRISA